MSDQETTDDMLEADLGLGDGLKPGALTRDVADPRLMLEEIELSKSIGISDSYNSGQSNSDESEEEIMTLLPIGSIQQLKSQYSYLTPRSNRSMEVMPSDCYFYDGRYFQGRPSCTSNSNCSCKQSSSAKCTCKKANCDICAHSNLPDFPTYADVPYGTSIRQQKELFKHNLDEIKKKKNVNVNSEFKGSKEGTV